MIFPMGYADMEKFIMEDCGGMLVDGKKLKAVIPGGSSVYIMNAGQILGKNVTLDYEGLVEAGSMLGTGGMMVMDERVDIMESTKNLSEFYKHESCGWCTPCREGTDWLVKIFNRISTGGGRPETHSCLLDICDNMRGNHSARSATLRPGRFRARSTSSPRIQKSAVPKANGQALKQRLSFCAGTVGTEALVNGSFSIVRS